MKGDFGNKRNTNGFDKNPDNINRKGQPISIKNQLKEILLSNGELPIPAKNLIGKKEINGQEYYVFKIPTQNALATRLVTLAMSKNTNGFNALKLLLETFDGKANQSNTMQLSVNPDFSKIPTGELIKRAEAIKILNDAKA